ncbi:unnamed protein product [Prorocentrum cordatum]|uniref:Endonuclease/exonuclease/phosphatase domain-containing protein n=1 Tax=Prorocentrum cordatum TaxID=2364126 RepID=A0ABN9P895_9DINO|nr:unnamed protein product [Polarella glacialis]
MAPEKKDRSSPARASTERQPWLRKSCQTATGARVRNSGWNLVCSGCKLHKGVAFGEVVAGAPSKPAPRVNSPPPTAAGPTGDGAPWQYKAMEVKIRQQLQAKHDGDLELARRERRLWQRRRPQQTEDAVDLARIKKLAALIKAGEHMGDSEKDNVQRWKTELEALRTKRQETLPLGKRDHACNRDVKRLEGLSASIGKDVEATKAEIAHLEVKLALQQEQQAKHDKDLAAARALLADLGKQRFHGGKESEAIPPLEDFVAKLEDHPYDEGLDGADALEICQQSQEARDRLLQKPLGHQVPEDDENARSAAERCAQAHQPPAGTTRRPVAARHWLGSLQARPAGPLPPLPPRPPVEASIMPNTDQVDVTVLYSNITEWAPQARGFLQSDRAMRFDGIAFVELRRAEKRAMSITGAVRKDGWKATHSPGVSTGKGGVTGGELVAVRAHLQATTFDHWRGAKGAALCGFAPVVLRAAAGNIVVVALYLRPALGFGKRNRGTLVALGAPLATQKAPWIVLGDWNHEPRQLAQSGWVAKLGGAVALPDVATTCDKGQGRLLDYGLAKDGHQHLFSLKDVLKALDAPRSLPATKRAKAAADPNSRRSRQSHAALQRRAAALPAGLGADFEEVQLGLCRSSAEGTPASALPSPRQHPVGHGASPRPAPPPADGGGPLPAAQADLDQFHDCLASPQVEGHAEVAGLRSPRHAGAVARANFSGVWDPFDDLAEEQFFEAVEGHPPAERRDEPYGAGFYTAMGSSVQSQVSPFGKRSAAIERQAREASEAAGRAGAASGRGALPPERGLAESGRDSAISRAGDAAEVALGPARAVEGGADAAARSASGAAGRAGAASWRGAPPLERGLAELGRDSANSRAGGAPLGAARQVNSDLLCHPFLDKREDQAHALAELHGSWVAQVEAAILQHEGCDKANWAARQGRARGFGATWRQRAASPGRAHLRHPEADAWATHSANLTAILALAASGKDHRQMLWRLDLHRSTLADIGKLSAAKRADQLADYQRRATVILDLPRQEQAAARQLARELAGDAARRALQHGRQALATWAAKATLGQLHRWTKDGDLERLEDPTDDGTLADPVEVMLAKSTTWQ